MLTSTTASCLLHHQLVQPDKLFLPIEIQVCILLEYFTDVMSSMCVPYLCGYTVNVLYFLPLLFPFARYSLDSISSWQFASHRWSSVEEDLQTEHAQSHTLEQDEAT